ncbi:MAG: nitroreductase family protein [Chrysiogenetes bacterium]|nr:nitroreductase family protein [Chrysiogenetes bacterium]
MTTNRETQAPVDAQFVERWSPRAFDGKPVSARDIESLFEAARWAPSSYNEQPWHFLYAAEGQSSAEELERFRSLLLDGNRAWAGRAPVLIFILARRHFDHNGKENRTHLFDTGLGAMSLILQAEKLGLHSHAMGGIHLERVYEELNVPKDRYEVICALAVGYRGDAETLPEELRAKEKPSDRKPLAEVALRGAFTESD